MSVVAGAGVSAVGYYTPFMIASAVLVPIGVGLMSTFTVNTSHNEWIGYQALFGIGVGLGTQQPLVAVQTVLEPRDAPIVTALMMFSQMLGGTIGVAIAQTVFSGRPGCAPRICCAGFEPRVRATYGCFGLEECN